MFSKSNAKQISNSLNVISAGSKITGDLHSSDSMRIDGEVEGNIHATGKLYIAESAKIKGNVYCQDAEICGNVQGDIHSKGLLSIKETGILVGDINYDNIQIEPGADLSCSMKKSQSSSKITQLQPQEEKAG